MEKGSNGVCRVLQRRTIVPVCFLYRVKSFSNRRGNMNKPTRSANSYGDPSGLPQLNPSAKGSTQSGSSDSNLGLC